MNCPHCQSKQVTKQGLNRLHDGSPIQRYRCKECQKRYNERTGTPMARLRTEITVVGFALKARTEGIGARAAGRTFAKSHTSILRWEKRLGQQIESWSPRATEKSEITIEGDEIYTRIGENLPPEASEGWTIHFIERESRYWIEAIAGLKNESLFEKGIKSAWYWAQRSETMRWFTDGERRYGQELWKVASVYLKQSEISPGYPYRKVWREGVEVAMKIKGSQGNPRIEWVKQEHPLTAISPKSEVHANHNEAHNAALRRRCSAYRRRQNLYAKKLAGLQRVLAMQRLIHNWVRPHWGLGKGVTPAMAMGFCARPLTMVELLTSQGFSTMSP